MSAALAGASRQGGATMSQRVVGEPEPYTPFGVPVLCVLLLTVCAVMLGCSASTHTASTVTAAPSRLETPTVAQVAHDHGLVIVTIEQPTRYAHELAGATDATGQPVAIATFASTADRDAWLKAAERFGTPLWIDPLDVGIKVNT